MAVRISLAGASLDPGRKAHVAIPATAITASATPATREGDQLEDGAGLALLLYRRNDGCTAFATRNVLLDTTHIT